MVGRIVGGLFPAGIDETSPRQTIAGSVGIDETINVVPTKGKGHAPDKGGPDKGNGKGGSDHGTRRDETLDNVENNKVRKFYFSYNKFRPKMPIIAVATGRRRVIFMS